MVVAGGLLTFDDVDLNRVVPGVAGVTGVVAGVRRGGEGQDQVAPARYLKTHSKLVSVIFPSPGEAKYLQKRSKEAKCPQILLLVPQERCSGVRVRTDISPIITTPGRDRT